MTRLSSDTVAIATELRSVEGTGDEIRSRVFLIKLTVRPICFLSDFVRKRKLVTDY